MPRASRANRGCPAEDLLALTHAAFQNAGTALMVPVPPPVGRLRRAADEAVENTKGRHFRAFYRKRTVADYLGVVASDGRALAVELKSVASDRWYPSKVPAHQRTFLERWASSGGLAYLLVVYFNGLEQPQGAVAKWPAFRAELAESGLLRHGVPWSTLATEFRSAAAVPESPGIPLDYLRAIRTVETRQAESLAVELEAAYQG